MHISLAAILEGVHISLVICVRGYTYHGGTHITATAANGHRKLSPTCTALNFTKLSLII